MKQIGLLAGAVFWGFGCDIFGRKWAFNLTIGITAVWGLIAAGSPNFVAAGIFVAFWSFGVGGNLPVDSAVFLEFLPGSHQYLLTVLSIFWALAQVLATLIAWPLLGYRTCSTTNTNCTREENFGEYHLYLTWFFGTDECVYRLEILCDYHGWIIIPLLLRSILSVPSIRIAKISYGKRSGRTSRTCGP